MWFVRSLVSCPMAWHVGGSVALSMHLQLKLCAQSTLSSIYLAFALLHLRSYPLDLLRVRLSATNAHVARRPNAGHATFVGSHSETPPTPHHPHPSHHGGQRQEKGLAE